MHITSHVPVIPPQQVDGYDLDFRIRDGVTLHDTRKHILRNK